ncbi:MAG: hypothetical protein HC883_01355 [Bdellovibrionaceae bacterium]|nr:hypothetical protein [Pseudobdellovibrionaceae bacterium]
MQAWTAADGRLFRTKEQALQHSRRIVFHRWCETPDINCELQKIGVNIGDLFEWLDNHYLTIKRIFGEQS